MAQEHDATIKSVTQPDETESPGPSTTTGEEADNPQVATLQDTPKPQVKAKGKRPLSSSSSVPIAKRTAVSVSTPSEKKSYACTDLSPTLRNQDPTTKPTDPSPATLQLTYHKGDIFTAPPRTLLIHACNTQGHWGAGIAKAFKTLYPKAYSVHHKFCAKQHSKANPVPTGTAQLIAPVDAGAGQGDEDNKEGHWIGCLFTSAKYGKAKDKPRQIIKNSGESMKQLLEMVKMVDKEREEGKGVGVIRMCKINSGKFGVAWEKTEEVLKGIELEEGWRGSVEVWEPAE